MKPDVRSTVFLVDDDPAIRKSIPRALGKRGYQVEVFATAESFLEHYQSEMPGCLLLDLSLPEMNGLELQQVLATRGLTIPIIFISGNGDTSQSAQALQAGAIDFLEKPFRLFDLFERLCDALTLDRRYRTTGKPV